MKIDKKKRPLFFVRIADSVLDEKRSAYIGYHKSNYSYRLLKRAEIIFTCIDNPGACVDKMICCRVHTHKCFTNAGMQYEQNELSGRFYKLISSSVNIIKEVLEV